MGAQRQLPVLTALPDYDIVAVCSQRAAAALKAAEGFGIPNGCNTIEELVNRPDVDLVLILNAAPQHEFGLRAPISAGKDVYCEWPLTPDPALSSELPKLADDANIKTIIGLQRGFAPALQYARDLVKDGYVGAVGSVDMRVSVPKFGPTRANAMRWSIPERPSCRWSPSSVGTSSARCSPSWGRPHSCLPLWSTSFRSSPSRKPANRYPTAAEDQLVISGTLASGAVVSVHFEGGKRCHAGVLIDITGDSDDLRTTNTSAFGGVNEGYNVSGGQVR